MRRREFIAGIGGAAAAWPVVAHAQQAAQRPVIGLIGSGSAESNSTQIEAFRKGLRTSGYQDGQNVRIEYRWAEGNYGDVPALIADLLRLSVNVLVVFDNTAIALAAKTETSTTPIVFNIGTDPIKFGLVSSLSRPDSNITGVTMLTVGLGVKRLEVLKELLPNANRLGLVVNPDNPATETESADVVFAGKASGTAISILSANTVSQIGNAFASAADQHIAGILIQSEPFLTSRRKEIAALAAKYSIPVIDAYREFVEAGGLMSYGASQNETRRVLGIYTGRLLKGEKPANLPVQQSTKIKLVINLKIAEALGLAVPTSLLVRADEVIE
jgi:putative ABC transport system substrate-binding protein